jgi:hypothetical protein
MDEWVVARGTDVRIQLEIIYGIEQVRDFWARQGRQFQVQAGRFQVTRDSAKVFQPQ